MKPTAIEALKSILEWTEDAHDYPKNDPDNLERQMWYERRLLMIRNAARAGLEDSK